MINTYILTSKRLSGHIEAQYTDGIINAVKTVLKDPLNEQQFEAFKAKVPMREADIGQLKLIGLHAIKEPGANEKLDLFCRIYKQFKGLKYIVSAADSGKVKLVKFDESMLTHYFSSDNFLFKGKHSISNLVKNYNELRAEIAAGSKSKFPDHFSKEYQDKLQPADLKLYWAHLRSIGLEPKTDRFGVTVDWIKKVQ